MGKRRLHIVNSCCGNGTLKLFFKEYGIVEDVLAVDGMFRHAPLFRDFGVKELSKRSQSIEKLFGKRGDFDFSTELSDFIYYDFETYDEVVVWHGDDVDERILLYLVSSLVKSTIFEVDIAQIKPYLHKCRLSHVNLCCCSMENTKFLYDRIKQVSDEQKQYNAKMWNRWALSDAPIRIIDKNDEIVEVGEDYYDALLVSNCSDEYKAAAMVIGQVLCECDFGVGDSYLLLRLIVLIEKGRLFACQNDKFVTEIEQANQSNDNNLVINGVNLSEMRFFCVKS